MSDFVLEPARPFDLSATARFITGWPPAARSQSATWDERLVRLAFLVDDWSGHAGVILRQSQVDGPVEGEIVSSTADDAGRVRDQPARVVSLDHDARAYAELGERGEVVGTRQRESGWLRPVLFHSPYEAACWAVLSARIVSPRPRASATSSRPPRGPLLRSKERPPGLPGAGTAPGRRGCAGVERGEAQASARRGRGRARGRSRPRPAARGPATRRPSTRCERSRGSGRSGRRASCCGRSGRPTPCPWAKNAAALAAGEAYEIPEVVDDEGAFAALADRWRPFRTWAAVLLRATA